MIQSITRTMARWCAALVRRIGAHPTASGAPAPHAVDADDADTPADAASTSRRWTDYHLPARLCSVARLNRPMRTAGPSPKRSVPETRHVWLRTRHSAAPVSGTGAAIVPMRAMRDGRAEQVQRRAA
jgi:hypothetical protein